MVNRRENNNKELRELLKQHSILSEKLVKYYIMTRTLQNIGQVLCSRLFNISLITSSNYPFVNGIDSNCLKVQINTCRHNAEQNYYFDLNYETYIDYALLVIVDKYLWIKEVWKIENNTLKIICKHRKQIRLSNNIKRMNGVSRIYGKNNKEKI